MIKRAAMHLITTMTLQISVLVKWLTIYLLQYIIYCFNHEKFPMLIIALQNMLRDTKLFLQILKAGSKNYYDSVILKVNLGKKSFIFNNLIIKI